jgi:hypothetical protein
VSATRRTAVERAASPDAYPTPPELARAAVRQLVSDGWTDLRGTCLEPSCGSGAWVRALLKAGATNVTATDLVYHPELLAIGPDRLNLTLPLRPDGSDIDGAEFVEWCASSPLHGRDFLLLTRLSYNLIIGNPPYSDQDRHIAHALSLLAPGGVLAFLLRVGSLVDSVSDKTAHRASWWRERGGVRLRHLYLCTPRPRFIGAGSDAATYAVAVWASGAGPVTSSLLRWR